MELLRNMMVGMIGNFYLCGCIIEKVENIDNGFAIYCVIPEKVMHIKQNQQSNICLE